MKLIYLNKYQKKILKVSIIGFLVLILLTKLLVVMFLSSGYEIKVNVTSSLPGRIWLINHQQKNHFTKGAYFIFLAPNDKMLTNGRNTQVLKMIKGVSGDKISFKNHTILINGSIVGEVFTSTANGNLLNPITAQIIPNGCYFAWTPALYSYDSRYTDIGLVCEKDQRIIGSAKPLF